MKQTASESFGRSLAIQLLDQRHDLAGPNIGRHGADLFETDRAALIDDVSFRRAVNAVIDRDAAVEIGDTENVWIAEFGEPVERVFAFVFPVETVDRHGAGFGVFDQERMFVTTTDAPRCPDVEYPDLAAHIVGGESLRRLFQLRQAKCRRGFVD